MGGYQASLQYDVLLFATAGVSCGGMRCYDFEAVVKYFRGPAEMARRMGVSQQQISHYRQARCFPRLRTYQIHVLTNGKLPHYRLPTRNLPSRGTSAE